MNTHPYEYFNTYPVRPLEAQKRQIKLCLAAINGRIRFSERYGYNKKEQVLKDDKLVAKMKRLFNIDLTKVE